MSTRSFSLSNQGFPPVAMETSSDLSKHGKDLDRAQHLSPEEAEFTGRSSHWAAEPNFNLSLASPRNPRQAAETFQLHGADKNSGGTRGGGKPRGKGAVTPKTGGSASSLATAVMSQGERENPSWPKSKIPSWSRSSEEASLNSRGEQRVKSPNSKSTPSRVHANSKMIATPNLQPPPPPTASSPRSANREGTQVLRLESALRPKPAGATSKSPHLQTHRKTDGGKAMSHNSAFPKTAPPPVSPRAQNQGPGPKPANSPAVAATSRQRDPGGTDPNEKAERDVQRKPSGPRSRQASGSNDNLDSKDSSSGSGPQTSWKSGLGNLDPPVTSSESSKLGPVLVSSRPSSAKRSPGSGPAKHFLGLPSEVQSSGSAPGNSSQSHSPHVDVSSLFQIFMSCWQVLVCWLLWPPPAPKPEPALAPQQSLHQRDLSLGRERPHGG